MNLEDLDTATRKKLEIAHESNQLEPALNKALADVVVQQELQKEQMHQAQSENLETELEEPETEA